ncbi:zinc finger, CCHC-type containing protein, partial [Tanacetum coccineum]
GFKQKSRIDYFDTFAPVACISTIRLLIAMTLIHNLVIHQMDVKIAFLNGDLDEEVYMNQPQGFIMPGNENKVCKLIKSLYGLKQAPKQWHQKFDEVVISNGYLLNQADKCVYSKFDESSKGVIICLYVDDMLIFGTGQVQVDLTKDILSSRFYMKDMGEADVILGIRIKHESNGISISQSYYIEKLLKKFNYFDCTPVSTPMDTSEKLMPNNGQAVSQLEYSRVIQVSTLVSTPMDTNKKLMPGTNIKEMDIIKAKTDKAEHEKERIILGNGFGGDVALLFGRGLKPWHEDIQLSNKKQRRHQMAQGVLNDGIWLNDSDQADLERIASLDEIKQALWERRSSKAPSSDGFSFLFLKNYWDLFKSDVEYVLNDTNYFLLTGDFQPERLAQAQIRHIFLDGYGIYDVRTVFSIWKAFGGNTRDLGSFGEETDKTKDLHQHLSRISTQKLETASQITRDAVTTHLKTSSQDLQKASESSSQEPSITTHAKFMARINKLLQMRQTIDSLRFKTMNEITNQSSDFEIFCPEERIKELELRTQQRNNFEEELFKDRFPTEKELAYHKELLGEPQPPFSTLKPKIRKGDP